MPNYFLDNSDLLFHFDHLNIREIVDIAENDYAQSKEFKYAPPALTVPLGTTVTWVNRDEEPHTVTSSSGAFASTGLVKDDSFAQTFTKRGTYQYFCALHPHMKATVVVR